MPTYKPIPDDSLQSLLDLATEQVRLSKELAEINRRLLEQMKLLLETNQKLAEDDPRR